MKSFRFNYLTVLALILVILGWVYCIAKDATQLNRQGDAALFEQLIENTHKGRGAVSQVFAHTQNFIDRSYVGIPAESLFERAINGQLAGPENDEREMFGFHAYFILYPISLLLYLVSSSMALTLLQTATFVAMLWGACAFVYSRGNSIPLSILFGIIVFTNPNFFLGIQGQFYPDRLFVCAGFALLCMLYTGARLSYVLMAAAFMVVLNERAALISGLLIGLHAFLFDMSKNSRARCLALLALSVGLLAYAFFAKKYILTNAYYSTYMPADMADLLVRLSNKDFVKGIYRNLINNGFLLALALFSPRYFFMALVVLVPNIVGSIGGAEKIGWSTHYHSYYFPVLVFAGAAGLLNVVAKLKNQRRLLLSALSLVMVGSLVAQQIEGLSGMGKPSQWLSSTWQQYRAYLSGQRTGYEVRREVINSFAPGELVSTNEAGMAMLHKQVRVAVYPLGLLDADGVLVNCSELERLIHIESSAVGRSDAMHVLEMKFGFDPATKKQPYLGLCLLRKRTNVTAVGNR